MEDFLLRSAESSGTGDAGMRSLREALACDPSHAKAWYRFGFLLRRQAHLRDAAARALELSIALKPSAAGPAHAEMTLLALERLSYEAATDKEESEYSKKARSHHSEAIRLNAQLTLHTLKAAYGEKVFNSFPDILAKAMEVRQVRKSEGMGRGRPGTRTPEEEAGLLVELTACEAKRALRDVLRLAGEEEAANDLHDRLLADLAGRSLPAPVYGEGA